VEVVTEIVKRRHRHPTQENFAQAQEREDMIDKEVKQTRRSTHKSFWKLGYQIRSRVKPNSTKKLCLNRLDVQLEDGLWRQVVSKVLAEEHLIELSMEQFSHVGATPLGYTELDQALDHTGDTPMAKAILEGNFEHKDALAAIVNQLHKYPEVRRIINPIVTEEDSK
jgi:hypothetical protein